MILFPELESEVHQRFMLAKIHCLYTCFEGIIVLEQHVFCYDAVQYREE